MNHQSTHAFCPEKNLVQPVAWRAAWLACAALAGISLAVPGVAADLSKFPLVPAFELPPEAQPMPVPLRWVGGWMLAQVRISGADADPGAANPKTKKAALETAKSRGDQTMVKLLENVLLNR